MWMEAGDESPLFSRWRVLKWIYKRAALTLLTRREFNLHKSTGACVRTRGERERARELIR